MLFDLIMEAGWGAGSWRTVRPLQGRFVLVRPEGVRYAARTPLQDAARRRRGTAAHRCAQCRCDRG